jgi:hypothetical protein
MQIIIDIDDDKLLTMKEFTRLAKKKYLNKVLEKNGGNKTKTAIDVGFTQRHGIYRIIDDNYKF